jgi:hypothetical protein
LSGLGRCRGSLRLAAISTSLTVPEPDAVSCGPAATDAHRARGVRAARRRIGASLLAPTALLGALGPGSSVASAQGHRHPQPRPVLHLTWNDAYQLLPFGHEAVAKKVTDIFETEGVDVRWQTVTHEPTPSPGLVGIRVVLMPRDSSGWGLPRHTMGVVIGKKVPRETVFIFFPNVARTLGYDPRTPRARSPRERARLTRALARVVAHEVVHAIQPDREHDAVGLLSLHLDRRSLLQPRLRLAKETAEALRSSLTRMPVPVISRYQVAYRPRSRSE